MSAIEILSQPQLEIMAGNEAGGSESQLEAVAIFNEAALIHPDTLQLALGGLLAAIDGQTVRPLTDTVGQDRIETFQESVNTLLDTTDNGRTIDYDDLTWESFQQSDAYRTRVAELRSPRESITNEKVISRRRRAVALTGLGIYALRLGAYHSEQLQAPISDAA